MPAQACCLKPVCQGKGEGRDVSLFIQPQRHNTGSQLGKQEDSHVKDKLYVMEINVLIKHLRAVYDRDEEGGGHETVDPSFGLIMNRVAQCNH